MLYQVGLWIDSGSRFETLQTNGVAHFLEHMAFKVDQQNFFQLNKIKIIGDKQKDPDTTRVGDREHGRTP